MSLKHSKHDPVPHKTRVGIIDLLLLEEVRKGVPNIFPREVRLINELLKTYPEPQFWMDLHLGYQLHSLAFFKTERGAAELDQAYRLFQYDQAQKRELESRAKSLTVDVNEPVQPLPKKPSPVEWASAVDI